MTKYLEEVSKDDLQDYPVERFMGEIIIVDNPADVAKAVDELRGISLLGFDTETRPSFKKGRNNKVSLLQLSTEKKAFLFRLNYIGLPQDIREILADSKICKVGVAITDDLKGLKQLTSFEPGGFIELQDLVKDYGIKSSGLKKLSAIILGFAISKRQQVTNWEREILSEPQIVYAATDAWVCHKIYTRLLNDAGKRI